MSQKVAASISDCYFTVIKKKDGKDDFPVFTFQKKERKKKKNPKKLNALYSITRYLRLVYEFFFDDIS